MSYYAVIDTNVLVSSLLTHNDDSATVIVAKKIITGELLPVYSTDIMREYREVLSRKKFKFAPELIDYILKTISCYGISVEPSSTGEILPDIKDLPFYEVVMEKRKTENSYLVTGNIKHFPVRPYIVTPREMLDILENVANP